MLVRFKDLHLECAVAELKALFEVFGDESIRVDEQDLLPFVHIRSARHEKIPWRLCELVCERSQLVEGFYEPYGVGDSYETLLQNLNLEALNRDAYAPGTRLKVLVETYGNHLTQKEKTERIFRVLAVLSDRVTVDLKDPTLRLFLFEQMRFRYDRNNSLHRVFFARQVALNRNGLALKYQLRDRPFLNTTSMDPCLSFVMANVGLARPGTLIFDPFVGSGSVLVSCAHFGASVAGSDYDPRVFQGEDAVHQSVKANFTHYGLQNRFMGVLRADFSQQWMRQHNQHDGGRMPMFDAIVTDPPYGVREGIKKIGRRPDKVKKDVVVDPDAPGFIHIPMRMTYPYRELLNDICSFAARHLVPGGRLVFWHASAKEVPLEDFSAEKDLPSHPELELLNVGLQVCGTVNRRMVLYKKV